MTRPRRAFTLIEVLVTVGIILVLMGLVLYGFKRVTAGAKAGQTRAALGTARGLLNEYYLQVKTNRPQPPSVWGYKSDQSPEAKAIVTKQDAAGGVYYDLWQGIYENTGLPANEQGGVRAPGVMDDGVRFPDTAVGVVERTSSPAIRNTGLVMLYLRSVPANRKVIEALSPDRHTLATDEWNTSTQYTAGNRVAYRDTGASPVETKFYVALQSSRGVVPGPSTMGHWQEIESSLLDAWGNPIIFVPADGLQLWWDWNDRKVGKPGTIIRNAGRYARFTKSSTTPPDTGNSEEVPPAAGVVKAPDGKPFFASAGPDGDFRTGDDNVYSFEE